MRTSSARTRLTKTFNAQLSQNSERNSPTSLGSFEHHRLSIRVSAQFHWLSDPCNLQLQGTELIPRLSFHGRAITDHHRFLQRNWPLGPCNMHVPGRSCTVGQRLCEPRVSHLSSTRYDALIRIQLQNGITCPQDPEKRHLQGFPDLPAAPMIASGSISRGEIVRPEDGWLPGSC